MDPKDRFTVTADAYARARPGYPAELVAWAGTLVTGRRAVDLGAGTGIATRAFLAGGWTVVGVEPNAAMRAKAEGLDVRPGTAEATGLPDGSADLVCAAQAFHWFALPDTLHEIRRLAPDGVGVAFWNIRRSTPAMEAYDAALAAHVDGYEVRPTEASVLERVHGRVPVCAEWRHSRVDLLDRATFDARVASASYVAHGARPGFAAVVARVFDEHEVDGLFPWALDVWAFAFR